MMDDYYTLLGVEPDAATDEIRTAYRERKATIDASSDSGKLDVAKLNKAWNVLSDPYQRGRYDEQLTQVSDDGDTEDDVEVSTNGRGKPVRSASASTARPARPGRQGRQLGTPTITPPPGTAWPAQRQRVIAMSIDLLVLLGLFIVAAYVVAPAIANATSKATVDRIDVLRKQVDADAKDRDAANKALSDAKKTNDQAKITDAQKAADTATAKYDADNKAFTTESNKLQPIFYSVIGGLFLVGFLYLVVPSIVSGRTLGKQFQHLRVLRDDGSPLRAGDAIKRYGPLIIVTFALFFVVGPLAAAIVLVGVIGWMRNANMQGIHDRFAHTMVVSDES
ncbi:MAG TPA: RDD family protein [Acidimicrobiia bacterium]|nr:RDD family protein [Acidimicrobiia bacterium]